MNAVVTLLLQAVLVGSLGVVAVLFGGHVVTTVFRAVDRNQRRAARPGAPEGTTHAGSVQAAGALLRGGTWIGYLERLAIYAAILAGYPEGIAIALAVKGLARYPELKSPSGSAAERFIIGTFTSVLFACACAGLAHRLLHLG